MKKRRALLIGVPEYKEPAISSFSEVVRTDIDGLERSLRSSNYQDVRIRGLDNIWEATRPQILEELEKFFVGATEGDTLLVYLSGHGLHHAGRDYLVPTEAIVRDPGKYDEYLIRLDFAELIEQSKAETVLVFVDACRQGVKLMQKASYAVGWGRGERAKVKRQCYAMVFACEAGEYAQYVTGEQSFSLFSRALTEVLALQHPAQTLAEVIQALSVRLGELVKQFDKSPQRLQFWQVSNIDEQVAFARLICNTTNVIASTSATNPWTSAMLSTEMWEMDQIAKDPALAEMRTHVSAIVDTCWEQAQLCQLSEGKDPWKDYLLPLRVLKNLSLLIYRADPMIELSLGELALALTAPFVREAVVAGGVAAAERSDPFSLKITGSTGDDFRTDLEKIYSSFPQLIRKATQLENQGKQGEQEAIAIWLMYRSILRDPRIWLPEPKGFLAKNVLSALISETSSVVTQTLFPNRVLELSKCIFGDPERIDRRDRPDALQDEIFLGGQTAQRRVREKLIASLLVLAGRMAIDARLLSDVLIDHLGLSDPISPASVLKTIDAGRWASSGRTLSLTVECPHQAIDFALTEHVKQAGNALEIVLGRNAVIASDLAALKSLPIRLTADGIRPAHDENNERLYEVPHIRFHLAQDQIRELLMGEQLYGDPALAIRELYQNALDACRYRDARLRYLRFTKQLTPALADWKGQITFRQGVDEGGQPYIECEDNGIGMGRRELSECFARAGRRFHDAPEFIEEQTEWRKFGIELYPNSQFGIGVFSYFMLADELLIETCRLNRKGVPGVLIRARVSGSGTLFRVTEQSDTGVDAGTRIRLYLNRTTHKKDYSEKPISVVQTLREILWVSEFQTSASDEISTYIWAPGLLNHPKLSPDEVIAGEDGFWWISKSSGGEISKSHYRSNGAILADGIFAELDFGDIPLNFVANLSGLHRPTLTVDRKKILNWDESIAQSLLIKNWPVLISWSELSVSWTWLLAEESEEAAEALTTALDRIDARLPVGRMSWHFSDDVRNYERFGGLDGEWRKKKIRIREVGCFLGDIRIFLEAFQRRLAGEGETEDGLALARRWPSTPECPEWLKPHRIKAWSRVAKSLLKELNEYSSSMSSPPCPILYPKDARLLNEIEPHVSLVQILRAANASKQTLEETLIRLKRLSGIINVPEIDLKDLAGEKINYSELAAIAENGSISLINFVRAVARSGKTVRQYYQHLSRLSKIGVSLPDIDLDLVGEFTFDENDLPLDWQGNLTPEAILEAAARKRRSVGEALRQIRKLRALGIEIIEVDSSLFDDLKVDLEDVSIITRASVEPVQLLKLSVKRKESVGETLRHITRYVPLGISVPDVDPTIFDGLTLDETDLSFLGDFDIYSRSYPFHTQQRLSLKQVLRIVAKNGQFVLDALRRWCQLSKLGIAVPLINPMTVTDFTIVNEDLRILDDTDRITVYQALRVAIDSNESAEETMQRLRKFSAMGFQIPGLHLNKSAASTIVPQDLMLVDGHDAVTALSLAKTATELGEALNETCERAERLAEIGVEIPTLQKERLVGVFVDDRELLGLSHDNTLGILGLLCRSVEVAQSVMATANKLKWLSALGVTLPRLPFDQDNDLVISQKDIKALFAGIIACDRDLNGKYLAKALSNVFDDPESEDFDSESFDTSMLAEFEFPIDSEKLVSIPQLKVIAKALREDIDVTRGRLLKFQCFGSIV